MGPGRQGGLHEGRAGLSSARRIESNGPRLPPERRAYLGGAYASIGEDYDRVRPGYPDGIVDWLVAGVIARGRPRALDVGAGTGKLTFPLAARGLAVTALDPSAPMLEALRARAGGPTECRTDGRADHAIDITQGTGEATGAEPRSVDVVTFGQSWHWCDAERASAEAARVLRPGGRIAIVWNQLDVSIPWVHRLSRIMRSGDVHRPGIAPALGSGFSGPRTRVEHWSEPADVASLRELMRTRSAYLRADDAGRRRLETNLDWYLRDHLGLRSDERIDLPYVSIAWIAEPVLTAT